MTVRGLVSLATLGAVTTIAAPSWAWKPYTHVYLAEQAYRDATDDGMLTIYKVDPSTGKPLMALQKRPRPGPSLHGNAVDLVPAPVVLGRVRVQKRVRDALLHSPAKFFAGVLGPDAYPDIVTGQMRIHPPGADAHAANAPAHIPDDNSDGPGTDGWLQALWTKAWQDDSDDEIAFATGYLAHAAGDIYAHTFMNTYAGGIFDLQDSQLNWLKHITVEGYVGERTPELVNRGIYDDVRLNGITNIEDFIAQNTWDLRDASGNSLYSGENNKSLSVPYLLGRLGETAPLIDRELAAYVANLDAQWAHAIWNATAGPVREWGWVCGVTSDCPDPSYSTSECPIDEYPRNDAGLCTLFSLPGNPGLVGWSTAWTQHALDVDLTRIPAHVAAPLVHQWTSNATQVVPMAMSDWVTASHNTAIHLFFTPDHLAHMDSVELPGSPTVSEGYDAFKIDMESILSGVNRGTVATINDLIDLLMTPVAALKAVVADAKSWVDDQVFQALFHMDQDQAKQCFVKPHMWLNPLLRNNATGMSGSLVALNDIMRLPPISPATCGGSPADRCTLSPTLVGTDVNGACDILAAGGPTKRFSVDVEDTRQEVFPAAFNALTMIKLAMADPDDVAKLANGLPHAAGTSLTIFSKPSFQPNAMLGFAATIDGSNEWLAQRQDAGWGKPMVFAQDCSAYANVFLDQRPNFDVQGQPLTASALALVKPKLLSSRTTDPSEQLALALWEPDALPCLATTPPPVATLNLPPRLVDTRATTGYADVTIGEPSTFSLASVGKNGFASAMTKGTLTVAADGKSARYVAPKWNPLGRDEIIVTSRDGRRRAIVPIPLDSPLRAAVRRDGLRGGETAQLDAPGKSPMKWSVVSGPGTVGDAKLEAAHDAKLAAHKARVAGNDKLLATHIAKLNDAACKGACRTQAVEGVRTTARARVGAAADLAQTKRQLDEARATYHAPAAVTKDEVVTLRGIDAEGRTATVKLRLAPPPPPLRVKLAGATLKPGAQMKLDVDGGSPPVGKNPAPSVPMTWKIVSGPGTVGDPTAKEREQKKAFLSGFEPLSKQLASARPFEWGAARKAMLAYIQASIPKYGASMAKLDEIDRTYHAPQAIAGKQRVTLRGTAADGRTVDVSFDVAP